MRKFLARSIGGADELAGYALAIGTAWGLGAALLDRAHIRIDSLYVLFPQKLRLAARPRWRSCCSSAFFALIAWHGLGVVWQSWTSGSRSQSALETPTVIPQVLWIAGLVGLRRRSAIAAAAFRRCRLARRGDLRGDGAADQHALGRGGGRGRDPRPEGRARAAREAADMLVVTLAHPARPAGAGDPGRRRPRRPRPVAVGHLFEAAAVAGHGRDRLGHLEQLPPGRDPVLRAAGRDPAALAAWPSACTARWCSGCRGCPAA